MITARQMSMLSIGCATILTASVSLAQTTWIVDDDACPGPGSGTPGDPFCSIQDAINASTNGDTVTVLPGTYNETQVTLGGKAITLASADGPDVTVIDGLGSSDRSVLRCINGEGPDTVIRGFNVTGGTGDDLGGGFRAGGGLRIDGSSPTVIGCVFEDNVALSGGGMYVSQANPKVIECTFLSNSASLGTGGGGGIKIVSASNLTVLSCGFFGNAALKGGGLSNSGTGTIDVSNCTFAGNWANLSSGAIGTASGTVLTLTNCTVGGNSASGTNPGGLGASSNTVATNCIFWGNTNGGGTVQQAQIGGAPTVNYSCVEGGWTGAGGVGIIATDPSFVRDPDPGLDGVWGGGDDDFGDLHLQADSPCIDAGDTTALPAGLLVDLDGNGRVLDDPVTPDTGVAAALVPVTVDMGADEFRLFGDMDGNGVIDGNDIQIFVQKLLG